MPPDWSRPDAPPPVAGTLQLWRAELDELPEAPCRSILSPDECERVDRFHFDRDRKRHTAARALLRLLLAAHHGVSPRAVAFAYGPKGKPELREPSGSGLRFNVSHSRGAALFGFVRDRRIGVDVEVVREAPRALSIAKSFFAGEEQAALLERPEPDRSVAFLTCWTRKEAYIKALGGGLSIPLDSFAVSLAPEAPRFLRLPPEERGRWRLLAPPPAGDSLTAVCLEESPGGSFPEMECLLADLDFLKKTLEF